MRTWLLIILGGTLGLAYEGYLIRPDLLGPKHEIIEPANGRIAMPRPSAKAPQSKTPPREKKPTSYTESDSTPAPKEARRDLTITEVIAELNDNPDMAFVSMGGNLVVMTRIGLCATMVNLNGQFGYSGANSRHREILMYPDEESALRAAWRSCSEWYAQEKADRDVVRKILGK